MKKVATLPTLVTLGNLFCGFTAIAIVGDAGADIENGERLIVRAAWLILLAMVFDALDGKVARMTNGASEFGAQLDSLSDIVSFGVAPAYLAKVVLENYYWDPATAPHGARISLMLSVLFVVCSALRLARYNTVAHDSGSDGDAVAFFRGLPTPGAAAAIAVFTLCYFRTDRFWLTETVILVLVPLLSYLMVSRIPYPHLANWLLRGRRKFTQVVQIIVLVVITVFFTEEALGVFFIGYLLWGPIAVVVRRVRRRRETGSPAALSSLLTRRQGKDESQSAASSTEGRDSR